jgi:hypothetical protein
MPIRVLVAYLLILLMVAAAGGMIWRAIYYSERNVRRRARHARRARSQAQLHQDEATGADDIRG